MAGWKAGSAPPLRNSSWIWRWCEDNYPGCVQILDFFHAKEKLVLVSNAHFKNQEKKENWLDQQLELLKDDGLAVIAVPNHNATEVNFFGDYWDGFDVPRHLWHFEPQTMEKLFNLHGFELIKKKSMPFDSFYLWLLDIAISIRYA